MEDARLRPLGFLVKRGNSIQVPAGTELTICAGSSGEPARKVRLTSGWFVGVEEVEPQVQLIAEASSEK